MRTPASKRLRELYDRLLAAYGPQRWWPSQSPFETVVGAYLTQNTSWKNVERSIANLIGAGVMHVEGLRAIRLEELQVLIRPSGYMVRKASALKAFVGLLDDRYGGSLEALSGSTAGVVRAELLALPGVGPETADAILLYALNIPVMVGDEYLRRVMTRHGLIEEPARYDDLQAVALAAFEAEPASTRPAHYNEFHALIVQVGKEHCGGVPRCSGCPLDEPRYCPPTLPLVAPRVVSRAGRERPE